MFKIKKDIEEGRLKEKALFAYANLLIIDDCTDDKVKREYRQILENSFHYEIENTCLDEYTGDWQENANELYEVIKEKYKKLEKGDEDFYAIRYEKLKDHYFKV